METTRRAVAFIKMVLSLIPMVLNSLSSLIFETETRAWTSYRNQDEGYLYETTSEKIEKIGGTSNTRTPLYSN